MNNIHKYKADFEALVTLGDEIRKDLYGRRKNDGEVAHSATASFEGSYQNWYTEACQVLRQLLPTRLTEFEQLYMGDGRRKQIDVLTYNIQDWLNGVRAGADSSGVKAFDDFAAALWRFQIQLAILKSVRKRFESSLFEITQLVQADLFDSELDAARELTGRGFLRAGGAVAGVVLEKHLSQVVKIHDIKTRKRSPTINDFNELLKNNGVLDIPSWRQVQRLGDIRNLCDHDKGREPTGEEVEELISGVEKYTKTLY